MDKLDFNKVRKEIVRQGVELNVSTIFTVYYRIDMEGHEYAVIKIVDKIPKGLVTVMPEYYDSYEQIAWEVIKVLKEAI